MKIQDNAERFILYFLQLMWNTYWRLNTLNEQGHNKKKQVESSALNACFFKNEVTVCNLPWDAYVVAAPLTLNRLRFSLWLVTFFCGWNMIIWTLGANIQPRTTKPLRLTEIHMVVVWTWRGNKQKDGETVISTQTLMNKSYANVVQSKCH